MEEFGKFTFMQTLDKPVPRWFQSLTSNLNKIEENKSAYEDLEEGMQAPSDEVFKAAHRFVDELGKFVDLNIEEPRINVSVNGKLGLAFGGQSRSMDVLFTPKMHFYFQDSVKGSNSGEGSGEAIRLVTENFAI
jgi:hypothetical protein